MKEISIHSRYRPSTRTPKLELLMLALMLALVLAAGMPRAWGGVRAQLDRDRVYQGDTVTLTIEAEGDARDAKPDLSVLNQDFRLLGSGTGTQIRIVNGRRSDSRRWTVVLEPKHRGKLSIPPVPIGSEQTRPLTLEVSEVPVRASDAENADLFIELETDGAGGFVQQEIPLTVRLYSAVPIREGVLTEPEVENARVEQLAADRRYSTERKGRRYQVIERRYALFPEKSGELRIPPVVFRGSVVSKGKGDGARGRRRGSMFGGSMLERFRNDPFFSQAFNDPALDRLFNDDFFQNPFGMFEPGKRISARSRGLTLAVKPRPAAYQGRDWLPAQQLSMEDSWAREPPVFRIGEPVTRTITVRARGAEGSQIPPLQLAQADGLRMYPDAPVSETRSDGSKVYGVSRQTMTYIPRKAGQVVVPKIELSWWNTLAGQQRIAEIPSWRISVEPGGGGAAQPDAGPVAPDRETRPAEQNVPESQPSAPASTGSPTPAAWTQRRAYWPWLAGAAALLLAALALLGWRRRARFADAGTPSARAQEDRPTDRVAQHTRREAFRQACLTNDAPAAARSLLAWATAEWPRQPPRSLGALATRVTTGADLVRDLERSLYARDGGQWQGRALWEVFDAGLAKQTPSAPAETPPLPPLYPEHG